MKKTIKLLCLVFSAILILSSCSQTTSPNQTQVWVAEEPEFVIEDAEYLLKIEILGTLCENNYTFVLTPEKTLLSQYTEYADGSGQNEKAQTTLTHEQISMIEYYLEKTKQDMSQKDISGSAMFTDYLFERMYIGDALVMFDYGTSESTSANLLTEIIIGCSNLKILNTKHNKLYPAGSEYRKLAELYAEI